MRERHAVILEEERELERFVVTIPLNAAIDPSALLELIINEVGSLIQDETMEPCVLDEANVMVAPKDGPNILCGCDEDGEWWVKDGQKWIEHEDPL